MEQGTIRAGGLGTVLFVELSVSVGTPRVTCWDHALGEVDRKKTRRWEAPRRTFCLHNQVL